MDNIIKLIKNCKDDKVLNNIAEILNKDKKEKYWKSIRNKLKNALRAEGLEVGVKIITNNTTFECDIIEISMTRKRLLPLNEVSKIVESFLINNGIKYNQINYKVSKR